MLIVKPIKPKLTSSMFVSKIPNFFFDGGAIEVFKKQTKLPKNYWLIYKFFLTSDSRFLKQKLLANFCFFCGARVGKRIYCLGREGISRWIRSYHISLWKWMQLHALRKIYGHFRFIQKEMCMWTFLCLPQRCQICKPAGSAEFCTCLHSSLIFLPEG